MVKGARIYIYGIMVLGSHRWQRHEKAVTGIALPSGSNKLLSSDDDDDNMNIGAVWGFHSDQAEFVLICPNGLAYALVMAGIILFVGVQVQKLGTSFAMQAALLTRDTDFVTSVPR